MCSNPAVCYLRQIASRISRNSPYPFYGVHACYYIQIRLCVPYAHLNKSRIFLGHNNMYVSSANTHSRTLNHNPILFDKWLTSHRTVNHQLLLSDRRLFICGQWQLRLRSSLFRVAIQRLPTFRDSRNVGKQMSTNSGWRTRRAKTSHLPRRLPEISQPHLLAVTSTSVQ